MFWSQVFARVFPTEIPPEVKKNKQRYSSLPREYQILHDGIKNVLLSFYGERVEHESIDPCSVYKVIFRRSESWKKVDSMLNSLLGTVESTDSFALSWIAKWQATIELLKDYNKTIRKIQDIDKEEIINNIDAEECLNTCKDDIFKLLSKESVGLSEPVKPEACEKVIQYLKDNWHLLTLFSEWEEVSMKEAKLYFRIVPKSKFDPSIIKAPTPTTIFTVEEEDSEITIDIDGDKFKRTKKVNVNIKIEFSDETEEENPPKAPQMSGAEDESKKSSDKKKTKDFHRLCEMVQLVVDNINLELGN